MDSEKALYAVLDQIRLTFNLMRSIGDAMHQELGISAAMRAVLERLARGGPQTVPAMARTRNVSRQHIQKLVDSLGAAGLVDLQPNPAHKRSPLVVLSDEGRRLFGEIERREAPIIADLAARMADRDLGLTARTLRALASALEEVEAAQAGGAADR